MGGDTEHGERRSGGPDDEIALITQWQFEHVGEFAMDDCEKHGVVEASFASLI